MIIISSSMITTSITIGIVFTIIKPLLILFPYYVLAPYYRPPN